MGEFFEWVNFTKKENLSPNAFENSDKWGGFHWVGAESTNAALTLMAGDWRGDVVALVGDETPRGFFESDACNDRMRSLLDFTHGKDPWDYATDWFTDVSGRFRCAEGERLYVREGLGEDADWVSGFYDGPFDLDIETYPYIVNETTKEYYRRGSADEYDPFSDLVMVIDSVLAPDHAGIWIGDDVHPATEPPGDDYTDITGVYEEA